MSQAPWGSDLRPEVSAMSRINALLSHESGNSRRFLTQERAPKSRHHKFRNPCWPNQHRNTQQFFAWGWETENSKIERETLPKGTKELVKSITCYRSFNLRLKTWIVSTSVISCLYFWILQYKPSHAGSDLKSISVHLALMQFTIMSHIMSMH